MSRALSVLLLLLVCVSSVRAGEIPAKDRIVILVTVDGFPAWIWKDPNLSTPTLKKLAAEGAIAGGMKISNPAVTWPNHTTLVTGVQPLKHGVLFNGLLTRQGPGKPNKFEPWRDKKEMVRVPTVYDAAFNAGLTTAHVDWIPTQNAGTFSWEFTERSDPKGPVEQAMVAAGMMSQKDLDEFGKRNIVFRDEIWTRAGEFLITKHKPNLLLFHLLTTDASNHKYGPGTLPSFSAYAYADSCIRRLIDALHAAGMKDRYTMFVTTDHGFKTAKRIIRPDALLRKEGLLKRSGATITSCDVVSKSGGGYSMLYITDPAKKAELTPRLKELFSPIEGIAKVYDPSEYAAIELPSPTSNEGCGDLYLAAKPNYAFNDSFAEGDIVVDVSADPSLYPGHHGYLNDDPQLNGVFLAFGYGIKKGVTIETMRNIDVAPTIAKLLGVELPNVDGKVLTEILE
ncbi:MAG TPA: alkaline phosphatase family protein [Planctomycetota bacterium]|nr:alkaline phosphatase family protein [Planctomycetota bacterium]